MFLNDLKVFYLVCFYVVRGEYMSIMFLSYQRRYLKLKSHSLDLHFSLSFGAST